MKKADVHVLTGSGCWTARVYCASDKGRKKHEM